MGGIVPRYEKTTLLPPLPEIERFREKGVEPRIPPGLSSAVAAVCSQNRAPSLGRLYHRVDDGPDAKEGDGVHSYSLTLSPARPSFSEKKIADLQKLFDRSFELTDEEKAYLFYEDLHVAGRVQDVLDSLGNFLLHVEDKKVRSPGEWRAVVLRLAVEVDQMMKALFSKGSGSILYTDMVRTRFFLEADQVVSGDGEKKGSWEKASVILSQIDSGEDKDRFIQSLFLTENFSLEVAFLFINQVDSPEIWFNLIRGLNKKKVVADKTLYLNTAYHHLASAKRDDKLVGLTLQIWMEMSFLALEKDRAVFALELASHPCLRPYMTLEFAVGIILGFYLDEDEFDLKGFVDAFGGLEEALRNEIGLSMVIQAKDHGLKEAATAILPFISNRETLRLATVHAGV